MTVLFLTNTCFTSKALIDGLELCVLFVDHSDVFISSLVPTFFVEERNELRFL